MAELSLERTWNHRICERCWFLKNPDRFPVSVRREDEDREVDHCCFCGTMKLTRIYVRHNPADRVLLCRGVHAPEQW